jgi:dolichol-phosphate mannosyltransferase
MPSRRLRAICRIRRRWSRSLSTSGKNGADIVWGKRVSRDESLARIWTSRVFESLIRKHAMPQRSQFTTGSFLLVDHKVAECFAQFQEHNRVTFALVAWTGFSEQVVEYRRQRRQTGRSGWTYGRMVKTMYDTFIGFSQTPIRIMTVAGGAVSLLTIPMAGYLLYHRFRRASDPRLDEHDAADDALFSACNF